MEFYYYAKDKDGNAKRGKRNAKDLEEVLTWIDGCGWTAINITSDKLHPETRQKQQEHTTFLNFTRRITTRDKVIFFRQFTTMISANIPIAKALFIIAEQTTKKPMKDLITRICERVMSGKTLAYAMEMDKKYFSAVIIAYIRAGEKSGKIAENLAQIAFFVEEKEKRHKKIISAIRYPAFVICLTLISLGIIVSIIVPQFEHAFKGLSVDLPPITRMTFTFGSWLRHSWYYVPIAAILVAFVIIRLRKTEQMRIHIDSMMLKIPIFGDLTFKAALSRSLHTLSTLLKCRVDLLISIEMAADAAGNEKVRRDFLKMHSGAEAGMSLDKVAREKKLLPPMVIQMMATGDKAGDVPEMLEKAAEWYDAEITDKTNRLQTLLEPFMIIFVGVVVGFLTLSIYLPMISAIQAML